MFRKFAASFVLIGLCSSVAGQEPVQPNILFIYVDDLNYAGDAIGGHNIPTPNLQRIVDSGVTFVNAHANGVICSPSRASMLTGIQQYTSGYYGYRMGQSPWYSNDMLADAQDMFHLFSNNGYNTYGSGKIFHGGGSDYLNSFTEYNDVGSNGPWAWDGVTMSGNSPERLQHPSMPPEFGGKSGVAPLSDIPSIGSYTGWINGDGTPFHYENDSVRDLLNDEKVRDYFFQKLATTSEDEPFFMTLGFSRPHTPFYLPEKYFNMHPIDEVVLPPILEDDLNDVPVAFINNRWNWSGNFTGYRSLLEASADSSDNQWWLKRYYQGYMAGVSFIDDIVGEVLDSLENSPFADNTYVIYTSDHGYHLGEKTLIRKTTLYDVVTRVPFAIYGPEVAPGAVSETPISLVDLYPTLVDIAGLPDPWHPLDGHSIRPLMQDPENGSWSGPPVALSSAASTESVPTLEPLKALHQHHSVRNETMRYTLYASGEEELFDYLIDSNEWFNLADDPQYAGDKAALKSELIQLTGLTGQVQEPDTSDFLFHGDFDQDFNGWSLPQNSNLIDASVITTDTAEESTKFARINAGSGYWMANSNIILEKGYEYTLSFTAHAQIEGSWFGARIEHNGLPDNTEIAFEEFELGTIPSDYEMTFVYPIQNPRYNGRLRLIFGNTDVYDISGFKLTRAVNETDTSRIGSDPPVIIGDPPSDQGPILPTPVIDVYPTLLLTDMLELRFQISGAANAPERLNVRVFNLEGKVVHATHIHTSEPSGVMNLPNLHTGVYIVQISGTSMSTNRKIVVQ